MVSSVSIYRRILTCLLLHRDSVGFVDPTAQRVISDTAILSLDDVGDEKAEVSDEVLDRCPRPISARNPLRQPPQSQRRPQDQPAIRPDLSGGEEALRGTALPTIQFHLWSVWYGYSGMALRTVSLLIRSAPGHVEA